MHAIVNTSEEDKTLRSLVFILVLLLYQILLLNKSSTHKEISSLTNYTVLHKEKNILKIIYFLFRSPHNPRVFLWINIIISNTALQKLYLTNLKS